GERASGEPAEGLMAALRRRSAIHACRSALEAVWKARFPASVGRLTTLTGAPGASSRGPGGSIPNPLRSRVDDAHRRPDPRALHQVRVPHPDAGRGAALHIGPGAKRLVHDLPHPPDPDAVWRVPIRPG